MKVEAGVDAAVASGLPVDFEYRLLAILPVAAVWVLAVFEGWRVDIFQRPVLAAVLSRMEFARI